MRENKLLFENAISDTLLIPLWMRAIESKRKDRLFEDTEAEKIVTLLAVDFTQFNANIFTRLGTAIRVNLFDNHVRLIVKNIPQPILVHLGCGLDNRFNRVDNGNGIHVNIDLPDVITLRQKLNLNTNPRNITMAGSILETDWMDILLAQYPDHPFFFFIEGVLVYFTQQQVKQLFLELISHFKNTQICFDSYSSWMISQKVNSKQKTTGKKLADYKWSVDNTKQLEEWHPCLKHLSTDHLLTLHPKRWGIYALIRLFPKISHCAAAYIFESKVDSI